MSKTPGLVIKGGAYYYRRGVPEDIRPAFKNKREVWITLRASDRRQASEAARAAAAEVDRQFRAARQKVDSALHDAPSASAIVADTTMQSVVQDYFYRLEKATVGYPEQTDRDNLDVELGQLLEGDAAVPHVSAIAVRLAEENELPISLPVQSGRMPLQRVATPPSSDRSLVRLVELVRRAEIEHVKRRLDRLEGEDGDKPHDPLFSSVSTVLPPPPKARLRSTLGETIHRFETDPTRAELSEAAAQKYILPFRALRELLGDDKILADIDRADCVEAFELLSMIPANIKKKRKYDGLSLRETAALSQETNDERISATTLRNHAHHISSFFNWAIRKGILTTNPATRMTVGAKGAPSTRKPFTQSQLTTLFAALPKWCEGFVGKKWLPLIALFSGMRLGEIATLRVNDVRMIDGTTCFVLVETEERSLKTPGATRNVPLHPELIRLGLLRYVEARRDESGDNARLFPDLAGDTQRQIVDVFQKRFSYFISRLPGFDGKGTGVSFHSFRHGFRDALREAGVPIDATRALGGWARSGGVEERYGQGTRPATLAKWMSKVSYPGLTLPASLYD